jgi:hypothetical protein
MTDPNRDSQENQYQVNVITIEDLKKYQNQIIAKLSTGKKRFSRENVPEGYEQTRTHDE